MCKCRWSNWLLATFVLRLNTLPPFRLQTKTHGHTHTHTHTHTNQSRWDTNLLSQATKSATIDTWQNLNVSQMCVCVFECVTPQLNVNREWPFVVIKMCRCLSHLLAPPNLPIWVRGNANTPNTLYWLPSNARSYRNYLKRKNEQSIVEQFFFRSCSYSMLPLLIWFHFSDHCNCNK